MGKKYKELKERLDRLVPVIQQLVDENHMLKRIVGDHNWAAISAEWLPNPGHPHRIRLEYVFNGQYRCFRELLHGGTFKYKILDVTDTYIDFQWGDSMYRLAKCSMQYRVIKEGDDYESKE